MKNKYTKISLNIIAVFAVVIFSTFIPDQFPEFFGDTLCNGVGNEHYTGKGLQCDLGCYHNPEWHWGYRHYLFFIMGVLLFVFQGVRIGEIINDDK